MLPYPAIVLGLFCAALVGCNDTLENQSAPPQDVYAIVASTSQYEPSIKIAGEVRARIQSTLSFRIEGRVTERLVDIGSRVRSGDVLARIDATEQRADVDVARAMLKSAEAKVKQKTLTFQRYQKLVQSRDIAQATFDEAKKELATAQGVSETAKANLATALDVLSYTELKADADGVITSRNIEVGQVVSAAQPALTLAHDGPRDGAFNVFEAFFLQGTPSENVRITPAGATEVAGVGKIREISPTIDTKTGTILVKVTLPEDVTWPLGSPILGEFRTPQREGIILPWTAMSSAEGDPAVWVIDRASKTASLRKVKVARYRTADFILSSGIDPEDLVVTQGGKFLTEGRAVAWEGS